MKMSYARNRNGGCSQFSSSRVGHGTCYGGVKSLFESYCKQVVKDIVKEFNENMVVIYAQLSDLYKDLELMENTMEGLGIDVFSVQQKVDNIEKKVETRMVGVLKGVFKVG